MTYSGKIKENWIENAGEGSIENYTLRLSILLKEGNYKIKSSRKKKKRGGISHVLGEGTS